MAYGYQVDPRSMAPEAREQDAIGELVVRVDKLQMRCLVPTLMVGAILWFPAFMLVRRLFLEHAGFASWKLCGLVALAPVITAGFVGLFVTRVIARQRLHGWIDELQRSHDLPRARLEALARTLRALA
jgi:hypothetical protein